MPARSPAHLGLLLFLGLSGTALSAQTNICPAPFPWTVVEVDERFGISPQEAADAVREAGMIWSTAIGNPLLFPQSAEGVPIRFVFDDRQEQVQVRRAREAELNARAVRIDQERADVARLDDDIRRQREVLRILSSDFESRQRSHNQTIESWNQRGGAPRAEVERLESISAGLAREGESLDNRTAALNTLVSNANRETERLNAEATALAEERDRFAQIFSGVPGQPAEYRDSRRTFGPFIVSRERSIDVFRFEDRQDLVLVLGRQLGYGLGLQTSDVPGAIMSVETRREPGLGPPTPQPDDLRALQELCARR